MKLDVQQSFLKMESHLLNLSYALAVHFVSKFVLYLLLKGENNQMNKNCLICGVGGQGIVLASRIIAACAMSKGYMAKTAETIGMAQQGGCVVSHVKFGKEIYSPLVKHSGADVLMAFEPAEAVRCLPYLKDGGTVIVSNKVV